MHELPIVRQILSGVLSAAEQAGAVRVDRVVLEIGEMHDLIPEWVDKFFRYASRGTIAEKAELVIERPPLICRCAKCGEHFVLHPRASAVWACSNCGSRDFAMLGGEEFSIREIAYVSNE